MKKITLGVFLLLLIFLSSKQLEAQWQSDGVPIVDTSRNVGQRLLHQIVEDGEGGAIICWRDLRGYDSYDVFAQRIDKDGYIKWQKNGVPICRAILDQNYPRMTSDGFGGAIIGWEDNRDTVNSFLYVQRIDKSGNPLWKDCGVNISKYQGLFIRLLKDGTGGSLVAWMGYDENLKYSIIRGQRINNTGKRMWGDTGIILDGKPLGMMPNNDVTIISDGQSGAFVFWAKNKRIYGQRIDTSGKYYWKKDGVDLGEGNLFSTRITVVNDNNYGAIITWYDSSQNVRIQRVDYDGKKLWDEKGIVVASNPYNYAEHGGTYRLLADETGGAFVGCDWWIYRFDKNGNSLWKGGVKFADDSLLLSGVSSAMVSDMNDGIINIADIMFFRVPPHTDQVTSTLYSQRIDKDGKRQWGRLGRHLNSYVYKAEYVNGISDGKGGAIFAWDDKRFYDSTIYPGYSSVFAQRINGEGNILEIENNKSDKSIQPETFKLNQNYPNPFNPITTISYSLPKDTKIKIIVYDIVGREVKTLVNEFKRAGSYNVIFDAAKVSSGTYYYKMETPDFVKINKMSLIK